MKKLLASIVLLFICSIAFSQITLTSIVSNVSCFGGSNGSATVSATGGIGPYTYTWTPTNTNSPIITGLAAGQYTVTVMDAIASTSSLVVTITEASYLFSSIGSQTNISCYGMSNGAANVLVFGGTSPYTYLWSSSTSTLSSAINLSSGLHNLSVTDINGCVTTQSIIISEPSQLVTATTQTNASCWGMCNGAVNVLAGGGTAPYAYIWSPTNSTTPTISNICGGTYYLQVTDAAGCVSSQTVILTQPTLLISTLGKTNTTCYGQCNGSYTITGTGGTLPYSYVTNTGTVTSYNANLCSGTYSVQVIDANGCAPAPQYAIINPGNSTIPNINVTTTPFSETCLNSGDGSIDLNISGSNPGPFSYLWSNGANSQDIANVMSGPYWVTITDSNSNCTSILDTINSIGVNCGSISGNIFIDNNSDCIKNVGDFDFQSTQITVTPGNRLAYTNLFGDYYINNLPYGTYLISLTNAIPNCASSLSTTVSSTNSNSTNNNLSAALNASSQPDLKVSAYSIGIVPGFTCQINYALNNLNNVSTTGLFKVVFPSAFIPNITTGNPNTYTLSGDTVIWNFNNITFTNGAAYFGVDFYVPIGTPLGSIFTSCIWAQPTVTDLDYTNNNYCYSRTVNGSFDPNDKTVNPVGVGANGGIAATETDLTYLIRFQNTGNGPAVNIIVKDTLSPNVNVNTFEMLGASHNYNIDILPGNVLRWKFNNIMLADSGTNELASHGYIQYRIKRTANNTLGTQIKNTAYIYFDFNAPVVTNTAINTIETITGVKLNSMTDNGWNIYPNPSSGILHLVNTASLKELSQIHVLNSIGQTVLEENINSNYKTIDLSKLNTGVYFVKITSDKNISVKRIVLSK